jgi:hypothetical protein
MLVRRLLEQRLEPTPGAASEAEIGAAATDGVRTVSMAPAETEQWITRSFPSGELGLHVGHATEPFGTVLRGRVWLEEGGDCRVLLVHEDHVLADTRSGAEIEFRFEEFLIPGWVLEIHPDCGRAWRFEGLG